MLERREIGLLLSQATLDLLLKIWVALGILRKTPLWKDILISFGKSADVTLLICFITFFGMLLQGSK